MNYSQENREKLLHAVRNDDINTVKEVLNRPEAAKLARAKNYYGKSTNIIEAIAKFIDFEARVNY